MLRTLSLAALVFSTTASAQALVNRVERAKDRQDLRQDRRQLADDRVDAARVTRLLADYDAAAAAQNVAGLGAVDAAFQRYLKQELVESQRESVLARQEIREDKRELRSDRRELRQDVALGRRPGVVADDRRDKVRDQVNLADDVADAARERQARERLLAIDAQLGALSGRFDAPAVSQKRALYAEVVTLARVEIAGDKQERREDRRELREDRRETREDRRDPLR